MADLTRVAEALAAHQRWSAGGCICGFRVASVSGTADARDRAVAAHQAQMLADAGLVATETDMIRTAWADALRGAADAWTQGAWAKTPRRVSRVADRMAAAQYVGDWLRTRADVIEYQRARADQIESRGDQ